MTTVYVVLVTDRRDYEAGKQFGGVYSSLDLAKVKARLEVNDNPNKEVDLFPWSINGDRGDEMWWFTEGSEQHWCSKTGKRLED